MNNIKCGVYLRAAFISMEVDVGGGVYPRAAFIRGRRSALKSCKYGILESQRRVKILHECKLSMEELVCKISSPTSA